MEPQAENGTSSKDQQPSSSILTETMELIAQRGKLYTERFIERENELFKHKKMQICTISELYPILGHIAFSTPIDPRMGPIYECAVYDEMSNKKPRNYSYILTPPSEGEESITSEDNSFDPTFTWLSRRLVDSSLLKVDAIEARKYQDQVPEEWKNIKQILFTNLRPGFELDNDIEAVNNFMKGRFDNFPWVKRKEVKHLYYKGKAALLVRFADQSSAIFAYFNFKRNPVTLKEFMGPDVQVFRCVQNHLRAPPPNWIAVVFRRLPKSITKEILAATFKKEHLNFTWMEEPVEIKEYKYALVGVPFIDDAFKICNHYRDGPFCKVNLHPNSSKIYKPSTHS